MLSRTGKASAAPRPRSTKRRDMCILVMITCSFSCARRLLIRSVLCNRGCRFGHTSHLERIALHDSQQQRRPSVIVLVQRPNKLTHNRRVMVRQAAPQRVGEQLLADRPHDLIALTEQRVSKRLRAVDGDAAE